MIRLLSYNIHKGIGGVDRRYRLERIHDVVQEENPDLICLQEVDTQVHRTGYHDQPSLFAERFETHASEFQLNVPIKEGGYGNLILTRWPMHKTDRVCLRQGRRKPRGAQLVVVDTPEGQLHLVNWHLGLAERERHRQVEHLLQHPTFDQQAHLPTVIVGDYNDWRNTLRKRAFKEHGFEQATHPARRFRSFPAFFPLLALDKCFYRGGIRIEEARTVRTPLTKKASDHLPLVVEFSIESKIEE